jgi:membrane associated rhomboid family serine protease
MQERTFFDELKTQYRYGGMHIRLILANTLVFLIMGILHVVSNLTGNSWPDYVVYKVFTLQTDGLKFIQNPWGLFTNMFAHLDLIHFLLNMLMLYFVGNMFQQFFSGRRLLHVYIIGGLFGGLLEVVAHLLFDRMDDLPVLGASGAVMALFMALAFYRPNLQVRLFGILPVRLIIVAGIFLLFNIVSLGKNDHVAYFAHVGGAIIGILSVVGITRSTNIINMSESIGQKVTRFFSSLFSTKPKMKVERGGVRQGKTDDQYREEAKLKQEKIDKILDKISKSGYDSLTKAEKEFLFSQSKNG